MLEHFSPSVDHDAIQSVVLKTLGFEIPHPLIKLDNTLQTEKSLAEYLPRKSGVIENLITQYKKGGADLPKGNFILSNPSTKRQRYFTPIEGSEDGRFFADGKFGFALGFQDVESQPLWLAAVSFCESDDIRPDRYFFPKAHVSPDYFSSCPLIIQIQACMHPFRKHEKERTEARKLMEKIRWEKVLVSLVTDWAAENHMPAVYLLPGELNNYYGDELNCRRARLRYNTTAERMGFIKEANGLYALHLAYTD